MQARMQNPAMIFPDAMQAILALDTSAKNGAVPSTTLELVHLRVSQINGCSSCVDSGSRHAENLFNRLNVTTRQLAGAWG
jgi:AhpD family alkylhydroperoxidase